MVGTAGEDEDDDLDDTGPSKPAGTALPPPSGAGRSRALAVTPGDGQSLPQTIKPIQVPSTEMRAEQSHI